MSTRAGAADVFSILDDNIPSTTDLTLFLEAAHVLTDRINSCAVDRGLTLTSIELRVIETYLAAHFFTIKDRRYKSKQTERASATFEDDNYLDAAMGLDISGCLKSLMSKTGGGRIQVAWLGKAPSDQIDYEDRD